MKLCILKNMLMRCLVELQIFIITTNLYVGMNFPHSQFTVTRSWSFWHCHWKWKIGIAYLFMRQSCVSGVSGIPWFMRPLSVWPRSEETIEDQRTRHRGNELRLLHAACCMCLALRHATHQLDFSSKIRPKTARLVGPTCSWPVLKSQVHCDCIFFCFSGHREHDFF